MNAVDAFLAGSFWLILAYLVLRDGGKGANSLLGTTVTGTGAVIKNLQGR